MENVDLKILLMMGDQANATRLLMRMRRDLAVPQVAGAEIVMLTANVLDALTSGSLVSKSLSHDLQVAANVINSCCRLETRREMWAS